MPKPSLSDEITATKPFVRGQFVAVVDLARNKDRPPTFSESKIVQQQVLTSFHIISSSSHS